MIWSIFIALVLFFIVLPIAMAILAELAWLLFIGLGMTITLIGQSLKLAARQIFKGNPLVISADFQSKRKLSQIKQTTNQKGQTP